MAEPNYSLLSDEDLYYLENDRWDLISDDALRYLSGEGFDTSDVLLHQAGRAVTSTIRGVEDLVDIPGISVDKEKDAEDERRSRMMFETNPVTSAAGMIGGAVADPVIIPGAILAPIKGATAAITGLKKGAVAGTIYGAVEPVYEEYGDSRVLNTLVGAGFGGVLGGVVGKLFGGLSPNPKKLAEAESIGAETALRIEKNNQIQLDAAADTIQANQLNQGLAGKVVDQAQSPTNFQRLNRETGELEDVKLVTPEIDTNLPKNLRGAKPRYLTNNIRFDNDLDKALYIIGKSTTKSKAHGAFVDWVKGITGLDDQAVRKLAKEARDEMAVSLGKAPMEGDVIIHSRSSVADRILSERLKPQEVVTPFTPQGVEVKSILDDNDLSVMENVLGLKARGVGFVDTNTGRFVSAKTVDERLEAAGVRIDREAARKAADVARAQEEVEIPGAPKTMASVGSRGVAPETRYADELAGRAAGMSPEEAISRTYSGENILGTERLSTSGKIVNIQRRGKTVLKRTLNTHNDLVEFILEAKKNNVILNAEEMSMIQPLVFDAMQKRARVIDDITKLVDSGASLDSVEALRMAEQLMYYSGIHEFYLTQGTMVSRAFNVRKVISRAVNKKNPFLKQIFPTVSC